MGPREETHSLEGEGVGGSNFDEGTDTLVDCVYLYDAGLSRNIVHIRAEEERNILRNPTLENISCHTVVHVQESKNINALM